MDIQHLLDRLEDLIDEGRHMPFSKMTMIDEERALEIIDQMRISIPEEIAKAARVLQERERILAQANEEAGRILQLARERGEQLIDREATVQAAANRANAILEEARRKADDFEQDASEYALETLTRLENHLNSLVRQVHNGIDAMNQPGQPAAPAPAASFTLPARQPVEVEVGEPRDKRA
jgi:cell division septum initiation protein DivIVA